MLRSKSHLLIFTSAYLHICPPSHLLTFTFAQFHISLITFLIFLSSYLVTLRLLIFSSSNLHIFTIFSLSRLLEIFLSLGHGWCLPGFRNVNLSHEMRMDNSKLKASLLKNIRVDLRKLNKKRNFNYAGTPVSYKMRPIVQNSRKIAILVVLEEPFGKSH